MGKIYAAMRVNSKPEREDKKRGLSIAKFNSQKFLSIITPSNLDQNMRKSMRIIPGPKFQKSYRHSEYRQHMKENSTI
jgi:hypothetical protein